MKHYILTRFNLGLYSENPYDIQDPDAWMERRIKLFEQYCLPSVQAQTCQDFTWLIAFDGETKGKHMPDLPGNVELCTVQPHLYIREKRPLSDWIITTRLDNDDIMRPEFIEKIQMRFAQTTKLVDIKYQALELATGDKYTSGRTRPNSPFISIIEPWDNPMTAMGRPHTDMPDLYDSIWINEVLAYQVIHDENIANKIRGVKI